MRPRLNQLLELETAQTVPDGAGGVQINWVALGSLWASIEATSGSEREEAGVSVSQVSHKITVRAAPPGAPSRPTARQRFRDGSRLYRITAVHDADRDGRFLVCRALEEVTV
ncbi:MAG: phage head closure protein [Pseudomonadota bacterium]